MDEQARAAFESDLQEALWLIEQPPETGSPEDRRLGELLQRIGRSRPQFAPPGEAHPYRDQMNALTEHIRSVSDHYDSEHPKGHPMSPLVGWDLDESVHPERHPQRSD
jgi:hypothetical protein